MFVHCCHCRFCQRETGSAFVLNGLIEAEHVHLEKGDLETIVTPTASGKGQRIVRCAQCKVALWSHYAYGAIGNLLVFVRIGTLDSAAEVTPDIHIFTASKQPWLPLPEGAVAVPEFYRASEHWPQASLERRKALFDKVDS
jgi:hypothetical protein